MKPHLRRAALVSAVLLSLGISSVALAGGRPDLVLNGLQAGRAHETGQLLIKYRDGTSADSQDAVRRGLGAQKLETVRRGNAQRGELALLQLPAGRDVAAVIRGLGGHPIVEYAEPNWTYQHQDASNDTYYTNGSLWGMYGNATSPANSYGSQAGEAWNGGHTDCSNVYVGIIDEGFMFTHEDLAANSWTNPFDPADGVDNDGNGYIDDVHGWDFDKNDKTTFDGTTDDHGTHVSGTIAGVGGNGKGVAGVCWSGIKLISAKFLGRRGGTTANAILAVDYLTDLKTDHGLNIVASNNSWGGGGFSQGLKDAIERANAADILFIAAAGNGAYNNDASPSYPASYPNANIIAVASITSSGAMSGFSQWGATSVDIGAPGSGVRRAT